MSERYREAFESLLSAADMALGIQTISTTMSFDCVLGSAEETLDAQILFDPF